MVRNTNNKKNEKKNAQMQIKKINSNANKKINSNALL